MARSSLLAAAGAADSPVRRVIVKSSTLVYGSTYQDPNFFREEMRRAHRLILPCESPPPLASLERVQSLHARLPEIARVARGNSEVVLKRGGRYHSLQQRHRFPFLLQVHHEFGPTPADRGVPWKAIDGLRKRLEPLLECEECQMARIAAEGSSQRSQPARRAR